MTGRGGDGDERAYGGATRLGGPGAEGRWPARRVGGAASTLERDWRQRCACVPWDVIDGWSSDAGVCAGA